MMQTKRITCELKKVNQQGVSFFCFSYNNNIEVNLNEEVGLTLLIWQKSLEKNSLASSLITTVTNFDQKQLLSVCEIFAYNLLNGANEKCWLYHLETTRSSHDDAPESKFGSPQGVEWMANSILSVNHIHPKRSWAHVLYVKRMDSVSSECVMLPWQLAAR